MTYSSAFLHFRGQTAQRTRNMVRASTSPECSGTAFFAGSGAKARSIFRMAFPHLREPCGAKACTLFSSTVNAERVSPILSSPTSRPKRNHTGNMVNESTPHSCRNTFQIQADLPPSGLDVVTDAEPPPSGALGHAGATATLHPSSRHPFARFDAVLLLFAHRSFAARWAALGCDQTSRHLFTETGAGALYAQRPCFSIQAREYQSSGLFSVVPRQVGKVFSITSSNRERSEFASSRPHNAPNGLRKQAVGGFHAQSLVQNSLVGACEQ